MLGSGQYTLCEESAVGLQPLQTNRKKKPGRSFSASHLPPSSSYQYQSPHHSASGDHTESSEGLFLVKFLNGQIKVCAGCRVHYEPITFTLDCSQVKLEML